MKLSIKDLLIASALFVTASGCAIFDGGAENDDGNEVAIPGEALAKASAAALAHTGGGTVTETEVGDEESYYEVEVTMEDGREIDVQLDREFNVVGVDDDDDDEEEDDDED